MNEERLNGEQLPSQEQKHESPAEKLPEQKVEKIEVRHEHDKTLKVEAARHNLGNVETDDSADINKQLVEPPKEHKVLPPNKELKQTTLRNNLKTVQSHLNRRDRALSNFIHLKSINSVTEFTAKSLARPLAILTGGLFTFIGSAVYLYSIRHSGYHYHFIYSLILFAGGFVFGLVIEILYKAANKIKS